MGSSAFDMLFNKSVPHILERIFFCLDHESFRNCLEVSNIWHELLTSEIYQKKIKAQYQKEITEDGWKLTATAGNVEQVNRFLIGVLDVNVVVGKYPTTPLFEAAIHSHKDVVQILLNRGADPNKKVKFGHTALHGAA